MTLKVKENADLSNLNTFGIQAFAQKLVSIESISDLQLFFNEYYDNKQLLILGGGSNVLFVNDFNGIVLKNAIKGIEKIAEDDNYVWIKAMGGEIWHEFVLHTIERGWQGLENLSLIPGSVGAAPMQNIGAYGVEIKDFFHELEAYHIPSGEIHKFSAKDCAFGYRESVFKKSLKGQYIILSVTFRLNKHPQFNTSYGSIEEELQKSGIQELSAKAISDAVIRIRKSKLPDPAQIGNAGSFFKNPIVENSLSEQILQDYPQAPVYPVSETHSKIAAGWLIEQCGWKGKRSGNCGVHEKQALVLVNYGGASGQEIFELSEKIISSVSEKFNIQLEREVNVIQ